MSPDQPTQTAANPLLAEWATPFGSPPWQRIAVEHFRPAFDAALAEHDREIAAIAGDPAEPSFDNTVAALERSGRTLRRVAAAFFNLTSAHSNDDLEAVERDIAPLLARHHNAIQQNPALFRRVDALFQRRGTLGLTPEQDRVLERYHLGFTRSGAGLDEAAKRRLSEIVERLATLGTQFGQNVLADEKAYALMLDGEADLAGLPQELRDAAAAAAADRGQPGKHAITLGRSSIEPFLQFSSRRDLRETAFKAWIARGEGAAADNRPIIAETVALRAEQARLLGYPSYADFRLADTMAKTPEAALGLLNSVWVPARARALREQEKLQALVAEEGGNFEIAAWDWRYYAEQQRKREFDLDESELKPYLQLERIIEAAFDTAHRLFGLSFREQKDVPVWHPDVRAWEVTGRDGRFVGLFYGDYFARPSKRSGAWMEAIREQESLDGEVRPIVVNVMNFAKAAEGTPSLLSFDDARTLFHEFGHALHGLMSDLTYPAIAGTNVARDFVEFPSQLYEHWLERPEILRRHALHYRTGEPMPEELLQRVLAARTFNQGFATVEFISSALVDLDFHAAGADASDPAAFERATLQRIGMPSAIVMRHRPPHFQHVFAGSGYSAGYYSYLWSEVLDADGFGAFEEAGDIFDPAVSGRLAEFVYSAGYRRDPAEAYRAFRGRPPEPAALLKKRGLAEAA
ncbi:M3 family metallopeptidase [Inquilinus limosus]|uniref:Peptidase M3 n=1 Tax=Inquilinus limosus MP06 TaxID=1398085 RepID=A0A0A0D4E0_9PROT|nr:M3 family metallopeptidase [Inquilinus limosus]KGM31912.1 peptidase M3 [Inquilinus limosus MP06]